MLASVTCSVGAPTGDAASATAGSAGPRNDADQPKEGSDQEYVWSLVDVELPSKVAERARALLGDRFVDVVISEEGDRYQIGVFDLSTTEAAAIARALGGRAPIEIVARPESMARLVEVQERLMQTLPGGPEGLTSIAINPIEGRVVGGTETEAVAESMATRLVEGGLAAADRELVTIEVHATGDKESVTSFPPHRAGKKVGVGTTTYECTTGFTIENAFGAFGTTAGHCGNGSVWLGGATRDHIRNNLLYNSSPAASDSSAFLLDSNEPSATLYRSSSVNRNVTGMYSEADTVGNLRVCARGAFTDDQACADVKATARDVQLWSGTASRWINNGYCVDDEITIGGDSGAPFYRVQADGSVWAIGQLKGYRNSSSTDDCFVHIAPTLEAFNAQLYK